MYVSREIESLLESRLFQGRALLVYGPRQTGKTTLVRHLIEAKKLDAVQFTGDSSVDVELISEMSVAKWRQLLRGKKVVFIDEAQKFRTIGNAIKLAVDNLPDVQVIATGSSAFGLLNQTSETLTGRKFEFKLLPFSFAELSRATSVPEEHSNLEMRLVYGLYPDIVNHPEDAATRLAELAGGYLYRDLFALEGVRNPALFEKIVRALALQLGSEVSVDELSRLVGADNKTVTKYLDLLEKSFVVFKLPAYSGNMRKEIRKAKKYYFYDLGVRNAVIRNFSPLEFRTDCGALWENYLILERLKRTANNPLAPLTYFWRDVQQHEIDYIEELGGALHAYEFKWNPERKAKSAPANFTAAYPGTKFDCVSRDNYLGFVLDNL